MKIYWLLELAVAIIFSAIFILPQEFGGFLKLYYVSSRSMEPNIPIGSLIIASPLTFIGSPDIGDVVVYMDREMDRLVAHRVVGLCMGGYIIKGDLSSTGSCIAREDVIAKSLIALPFIGWLGIVSTLTPLIIIPLIVFLILPKGAGSLYPLSSVLSLLPTILPLRDGFPRFFGDFTGLALTIFLASGSIVLRFAERYGVMQNLVDLTYIILSIVSIMVVEVPWLW
ncbi:MAG: S26 family signal peptidase [Nitrososphaerota archaeon]